MIKKEQIKRIYSLGSGLNLIDNKNKGNDLLHELVYGITGKEHISKLNDKEFKEVEKELLNRMRMSNQELKPKRKPKETVPNMMTSGQQNKAWQLMYRLVQLSPSSATVGERMAGALKTILGVTASNNSKDMFRWVSYVQGSRLIETLKKYVESAEKKGCEKINETG